ncbi:hypothetical protein [Chamaesiphon polymorphus]|uniref:Uncharacterized protein n=1 Tax=Chamaesiphon polymorphus CCALA 037 TaxID=2107692 RepID=A0A2T1FDR6_9CYAN|nr:hypothetical protein [Chamaesiphon polymorphus]PSB43101.1 hypothetical protein C7B77_26340 [Chamaesiphon polymorphus CCALA 037]
MTIDCRSRKGWCLRSLSRDCHRFAAVKISWLATVAIVALTVVTSSTSLQVLSKPIARSIVNPTANGVYLYGESPYPNVVGKEYIIFETRNKKTIGAFYLPRSEFSCFYGQFKGSRLYGTIVDPFNGKRSNFTLTLDSLAERLRQRDLGLNASNKPILGKPVFQQLRQISNNDRRILAACKQQLGNRG